MHVEDVSVVMTNYNYAQFLPRAVKAVLSQTARPREFVVIDDCSTDDSMAILEEFARQDSLLRVVRNEKNIGAVDTINKGNEIVSGKYVTFLSSDDYILPGMIDRSMALLKQYPQAGISCGYLSVIKEPPGKIVANPMQWCDGPAYLSPAGLARVIGSGCIPGHTAIYKREALLEIGGFDRELRWHCDWFASLVTAFRHGLCHIPDTIALFSQRATTYSGAGMRNPLEQHEVLRSVLRRLISPGYKDVLPLFQSSGVMMSFGSNLVYAAAEMPERLTPGVLGLINGMDTEVYEALLDDKNAEVRELSKFLLGPMWWRRKQDLRGVPSTKSSRLWKILRSIRQSCRLS